MTLLPRFGLTLAALLALAACSSESPTNASEGPAPASTAAQATANPASPAAGTSAATDATAATDAQTPATGGKGSETLVRTPGPIVAPEGPAPVAGVDYVEIPNGQPFQPNNNKIEVVEVFGYTCPACASFEPLVTAWATKLPEDVQFTPLAAPFGGHWDPFAKAFYAAQANGLLAQSHDAMFNAVHLERSLPPDAKEDQIAQFYSRFGADPKQFANAMASFSVKAKMSRALKFMQHSGVESTPDLVVDGKYRIIVKDWEQKLNVAEHLIAAERAAKAAPQADTAPAGDAATDDRG
ncbi:thiol:disulfide interchange protein DsbA/DsbL [Lysobacter sp. A03]|uniref:thiol:disulfide interchange protein DsbA/DsbL n=1 Tax=Lysobacter sp. A03 TaxID=1199154 RepID=UPI0005B725A4|nr:thiol:disulfide interchange protein DsbA/DsbL [Lysobacter sp. A03]KIQ97505.1 Periplasmic thiol:disulfide interchange protein DsbA [Lysobacter sp. A03]